MSYVFTELADTLWVAHSKDRLLHCGILQIWSCCVLLFFFLGTSSLHLLGLKIFDFCFLKAAEASYSKIIGWRSIELIGYEMWSLMQKNCAVSKHQSPKGGQLFCFYFYWLSFHKSVKFHYRKIRVMCCGGGRHEKSI